MDKTVRRLEQNINKYAEGGAVTITLYGDFLNFNQIGRGVGNMDKIAVTPRNNVCFSLHQLLRTANRRHCTRLFCINSQPPPPQAEKGAENTAKFIFHCTDLHEPHNY